MRKQNRNRGKSHTDGRSCGFRSGRRVLALLVGAMPILAILAGCASCTWNLDLVDYAPIAGGDLSVSTPEEQGLDPMLVAKLFYNAAKVETIEALLVIKNGQLIAEGYFNAGGINERTAVASVTKSYVSALTGIALDQGYLTSLDQKMVEFFPELMPMYDSRKEEITIRQMLQMRAGYPWDEAQPYLLDKIFTGMRTRYLAEVPLNKDPGSAMEYSSLTSHILGVVVARAVGTDLETFAEANLFSPLSAVLGGWITDWEGNNNGHGDLQVSARDMAKFGLLYLNDGVYEGTQVIPAQWVQESLTAYSEDAWHIPVGRNYADMGYGYQWWSVRSGAHRFWTAWGHGGQQIVLLDELDMVIVLKADQLHLQVGAGPWKKEKANLNLVGNFIASLPSQ